jgi:hypothetical protein
MSFFKRATLSPICSGVNFSGGRGFGFGRVNSLYANCPVEPFDGRERSGKGRRTACGSATGGGPAGGGEGGG